MNTYTPSKCFVVCLMACLFVSSVLTRAYYIKSTVIISPIRADARQYIVYGYNLAHHGTFSKTYPSDNPSPDSFRSPGYPLLVGLSFLFGGDKGYYDLLLNFQALLGGFVPVTVYMAGILFLPFMWSMAAAVLVAFNPHLISMTSYCLTETLFSFTLSLSILFFLYAMEYNKKSLFIISSFFWGYSYLSNETVLFLPYILVGFFLFFNKGNDLKKINANFIIFIIIFTLFPGMWMTRNAISLSTDAPKGNSRAIATMSHGSYPGFIYKTDKYKYFPYREDPEQPVFGSSLKVFTNILWQRIKKRPLEYLTWYCFQKPYYLWSWNVLQGLGDIYVYPVSQSLYSISKLAESSKMVFYLLHPFFLFFAFSGSLLTLMIFFHKNNNEFLIINKFAVVFFIIFIYYTLLYTIFAPWPRYSIPLRPIFYLCGLWALHQIRNWKNLLIMNNYRDIP